MNYSLSEFADINQAQPSLTEVINDFCTQVDEKFFILIFLIYTYFILRLIIIRLEELFIEFDMEILTSITDMAYGIVSTLGMLSCAFILVYVSYQNPPSWFWWWVGILLLFIILVRTSQFKSFIDNEGMKKLTKKYKNLIEKLGANEDENN